MELRLFKEPYPEPFLKGRLRLLFERVEDIDKSAKGRGDFYLYVWIQDLRRLAGFQAVLDEEFVLDFHPPSRFEFTRMGGRPLKRSRREPGTSLERKRFLAHTSGMESPLFPNLIRRIESLVRGEPAAVVDLTQEERQRLLDLLPKEK